MHFVDLWHAPETHFVGLWHAPEMHFVGLWPAPEMHFVDLLHAFFFITSFRNAHCGLVAWSRSAFC